MGINEIIKQYQNLETLPANGDLLHLRVAKEQLADIAADLFLEHSLPLSSMFASDERAEREVFAVHVVFSLDQENKWLMLSADIDPTDPSYPSVTRRVMAAHWYERYIQDMFGIRAEGHPDPRRLVHHENIPAGTYPLRKDFAWDTRMAHAAEEYPMQHIEGEGIYEIPVGPIHAGIIEPGHFRFNVAGERILMLEGKLFFTHKGVEKLLEGKTLDEALPFVERVSGDMAASHALAFAQAAEKIAGCAVPQRALLWRAIISECERITMHVHDLANIGGMGTGYSFIAANGFRIKERMMRLSEEVCGNRFWRGLIVPGGLSRGLDDGLATKILAVCQAVGKEIGTVVATALDSEGFLDRLQYTGILPEDAARAFGAVGLPARASEIDRDTRRDHPYAAYGQVPLKIAVKKSRDVFARYRMRLKEIENSLEFLAEAVGKLSEGPHHANCDAVSGFALGAVESWRGELICALGMKGGRIDRCFPRDPSFCNWALFGLMGPGNIVPDFPLINKSLNLSYSGTDL